MNSQHETIAPIYYKKELFVIEEEKVHHALGNLKNDKDLGYDFCGIPYNIWGQNTYNCVTYADKILRDCGIETEFNMCWVKNATNFIECCTKFQEEQRLKNPDLKGHEPFESREDFAIAKREQTNGLLENVRRLTTVLMNDTTIPPQNFAIQSVSQTGSSGGQIGYERARQILENGGAERDAYIQHFQEENPQYTIQRINSNQEKTILSAQFESESAHIKGQSSMNSQHLHHTGTVRSRKKGWIGPS